MVGQKNKTKTMLGAVIGALLQKLKHYLLFQFSPMEEYILGVMLKDAYKRPKLMLLCPQKHCWRIQHCFLD